MKSFDIVFTTSTLTEAGFCLTYSKGDHYIHLTLDDPSDRRELDIATNLYDYAKGKAKTPSLRDFESAANSIIISYGL